MKGLSTGGASTGKASAGGISAACAAGEGAELSTGEMESCLRIGEGDAFLKLDPALEAAGVTMSWVLDSGGGECGGCGDGDLNGVAGLETSGSLPFDVEES